MRERVARRKAQTQRQQRHRGARPQYTGDYKQRAKAVRDNATICWLCGEGDRGRADPWQADHLMPAAEHGGEGPLIAAHRSCNIARANRLRAKNERPDLSHEPQGRRAHLPTTRTSN